MSDLDANDIRKARDAIKNAKLPEGEHYAYVPYSLDDKLREILQNVAKEWVENDGRPKHLLIDLEESIPQIHQAYKEAGYLPTGDWKVIPPRPEDEAFKQRMTGQTGC